MPPVGVPETSFGQRQVLEACGSVSVAQRQSCLPIPQSDDQRLAHLFVRCERLQFDAQTDQQANHQFNVANQRAARSPDSLQLTRSPGAGFGQDTSRLDDASKRMAGLACGGPQAFRLLRRDIHRETAGDGAAFVMYLEHDPHR